MALNKLHCLLFITLITAYTSNASSRDENDDDGGGSFIETILEWVFGLGTEGNTKEVTETPNAVTPTWTSIFDTILQSVFGFSIESGKRNMQEAISNYLDLIFSKKDDVDSDLLKQLFMIYSDSDDMNFSSNFVGLEESA